MLQTAISVLEMICVQLKCLDIYFALSHGMLLSKSESIAVSEQIVERAVIWDAMALMWSLCNDNAAKCDFGITNDYVFNERVLMLPLLLAKICRWTNTRVTGDLPLIDAHIGPL